MTRFTKRTEKTLREAGWYPGRDVSAGFEFFTDKKLFPEALKVFKEFGYLHLWGGIWMDIDESLASLKLRCKVEGLSYSDKDIDSIRQDSEIYKMQYHTDYLHKKYGIPFTRICTYKDNELPSFDEVAFMSETGEIYITEEYPANDITSWCVAPTFDEFLKSVLDFEYQATQAAD